MKALQHTAPSRILRLPEVVERIGMSRGSVYLWMSRGQFPKSIRLGARSIGGSAPNLDITRSNQTHIG